MINNTFFGRISYILGKRKMTPWAKSIGLKAADVTRIKNGHTLGPEKLIPISKAENVSLSWLLNGSGEPYMVHHATTDDETSQLLSTHIEDEGWQIVVLNNPLYPAIILTLPCVMQVSKNEFSYTAVEIIAGPIGPETLSTLKMQPIAASEIALDEFTMRRLYAGKMGNQDIIGNAEDALLNFESKSFKGESQLYDSSEKEPAKINLELLKLAISYTEETCTEDQIKLDADQKSRVIAALYKNMLRTHTKTITKEILLMTLDAI